MSISFETTQTITVECQNTRAAIEKAIFDVPFDARLVEVSERENRTFADALEGPRVILTFTRRVIE